MDDILSALDNIEAEIEQGIKSATVKTTRKITSVQGVFSGQLRASNNVGIGAADLNKVVVANYVRGAISRTADLAELNAKRIMGRYKLGRNIYISNNHDYAIYDEYKHGRLAYETGFDYFPRALKFEFK